MDRGGGQRCEKLEKSCGYEGKVQSRPKKNEGKVQSVLNVSHLGDYTILSLSKA